jgi:mannosyltransferase OCH1-like enzyme
LKRGIELIPKILLQTTREKIPQYVIDMLTKRMSPEWRHEIFNDETSIKYLESTPSTEFPDLVKLYKSIKTGAHRSDLFRYWYLYNNGGVFLDDDAMIYIDLDCIIKDYECFFVQCYHAGLTLTFNGFLGVEPKNEIIYDSLKALYYTAPNDLASQQTDLNKYLRVLIDTNTAYNSHQHKYNHLLMHEEWDQDSGIATTSHNGKVIMKHFQISKIITT